MKPDYFVRTPFNYDLDEASDASAVAPGGPSLTIQSQTPDVDINVLMQRYGITGQFPDNPRIPQYGDFSHITDFRSALDAVRDAEAAFMEYPADVRARFQNDPQALLEFAATPGNEAEGVRLGLWKERMPPASAVLSSDVPATPGAPAVPAKSPGQ